MGRRYRRRIKDDGIEAIGWLCLGALGVACLAKKPAASLPPPPPAYIGIPTAVADFVAAAQEQDMWCWAACIQMILNFYGIPITQQEIVTRVYRSPVNEPASDEVISASLNGWGINADGRRFVVCSHVGSGPPAASVLTRELSNGRPVLLAFNSGTSIGHAVLITAASRVGSLVSSVVYRDPSPTSENMAAKGRVELAMDRLAEFLPGVRSHWLVSVKQFQSWTMPYTLTWPGHITRPC